jgi:heme/copper-type cytochrome/quinol oxidase subunit 2
MQPGILFAALITLIAGVFMIATSAIGKECYDKNPKMKEEKKSNDNFLILNIIMAVVVVLVSFLLFYLGFQKSGSKLVNQFESSRAAFQGKLAGLAPPTATTTASTAATASTSAPSSA